MAKNTKKDVLYNVSTYDDFLDDAVHAVNELWLKAGGQILVDEELYDLNNKIQEFFQPKLCLKAMKE